MRDCFNTLCFTYAIPTVHNLPELETVTAVNHHHGLYICHPWFSLRDRPGLVLRGRTREISFHECYLLTMRYRYGRGCDAFEDHVPSYDTMRDYVHLSYMCLVVFICR